MHRLAVAAIFVSASAFAQTTPPAGSGTGFFRPTPTGDPSLTNPPPVLPPAAAPEVMAVEPATPVVVPVEVPVAVPAEVPVAAPVVSGREANAFTRAAARAAEIELDRAEREAVKAQARARDR